jgi:hypothetical protein
VIEAVFKGLGMGLMIGQESIEVSNRYATTGKVNRAIDDGSSAPVD